jgi:anti-sigma B factor antagonist
MQISTEDYKQAVAISVAGRVDSSTAPELESALKKLVEANKTRIVLDLKGVEYMSSAGLRAMVSTLKAVKRVNGDLRLACPSPRVEEVLRLAGLTSIFSIYGSRELAADSFPVA